MSFDDNGDDNDDDDDDDDDGDDDDDDDDDGMFFLLGTTLHYLVLHLAASLVYSPCGTRNRSKMAGGFGRPQVQKLLSSPKSRMPRIESSKSPQALASASRIAAWRKQSSAAHSESCSLFHTSYLCSDEEDIAGMKLMMTYR